MPKQPLPPDDEPAEVSDDVSAFSDDPAEFRLEFQYQLPSLSLSPDEALRLRDALTFWLENR